MNWNKKDINSETVISLSKRFNLSLIEASILVRRDIKEPKQITYFIEDDLRYLHNPFLFNDMEKVVDRILAASDEGEKVLIYGDRDVDGITSTVLMVELMEHLNIEFFWHVPSGKELYGIDINLIEEYSKKDVTLIITVDCGISNSKEVDKASEFGIDVIITDHHKVGDKGIPAAFAIVNPSVPTENYPFKKLAGCGVVHKIIWAICFGQTDYYNQNFLFLTTKKIENGSINYEILSLTNFKEYNRKIINSNNENCASELIDSIKHELIIVFDKDYELSNLRAILGSNADIYLYSLKDDLIKIYPKSKNDTLISLHNKSRFNKYRDSTKQNEIDTLINLFKLISLTKEEERFRPYISSLDLTAIGTISDLMDLKDENRIIVKRGLARLNRFERSSIRDIAIRKKLIGKIIGSVDVSWYISPWINSAGRMEQGHLAVSYLLSKNIEERETLGDQIDKLNASRREMGDILWEKIYPEALNSLTEFNNNLILIINDEIPRGITGILAVKLNKALGKPAIILSSKDNLITGSIRCDKGFNMKLLSDSIKSVVDDFGGHDCAAGFSLSKNNKTSLITAFKKLSKSSDLNIKVEEDIFNVDAEIPSKYMNNDLKGIIEKLEPFGQGFPQPLFLVRNIEILTMDLFGKDSSHVRFNLAFDKNGIKWPALFWKGVEGCNTDFSIGDKVDILFFLEKNFYRNNETLQLNVQKIIRGEL